jgi:hypothetical protein
MSDETKHAVSHDVSRSASGLDSVAGERDGMLTRALQPSASSTSSLPEHSSSSPRLQVQTRGASPLASRGGSESERG